MHYQPRPAVLPHSCCAYRRQHETKLVHKEQPFNNTFRQVMRLPRNCSDSNKFFEERVNSFVAIRRNRIVEFMSRIDRYKNAIFRSLSDRNITSCMYKHRLKHISLIFYLFLSFIFVYNVIIHGIIQSVPFLFIC